MPHTNRKHKNPKRKRDQNQPSCTECLTDQQYRKVCFPAVPESLVAGMVAEPFC